MSQPKRCPFCGGDEIDTEETFDQPGEAWIAFCMQCGAQGPMALSDVSAMELWEQRWNPLDDVE